MNIPKVWINKITFYDGTEIPLDRNDIIVFVGPNNSGKSASLREIYQLLKIDIKTNIIIKNIDIEREGNEEIFSKYVETISTITPNPPDNPQMIGFNYNTHFDQAINSWLNYKLGLNHAREIFVTLLSTNARLSISNPPQNIEITKAPPQHPIHFLQQDDKLESEFSNYFKQAFGLNLILHRNAGRSVPLYIGNKPKLDKDENEFSVSYYRKVESLPLLHEQGDGMLSFVGVLLYAFITRYSILLIDEPEAFLHPPQARLIGKMLAKDLPIDRQLFLATHSEDFLKGLLDSGNKHIKVIRINRDESINHINQLDENDIKDIWKDSLLRHSNILNGLFHKQVVICEGDADCRFYSALVYSLYEGNNEVSPDIMFTHCGGKDRINVAIKALIKLGISLKVVLDFDVLNDKKLIEEIILNLKGNWQNFEKDWQIIKNSVESKKPELEVAEVRKQIDMIFSQISSKEIDEDNLKNLKKVLKKSSPWGYAKEMGKTFIPNGEASKAFEQLNTKAKEIGLFIVEFGELESFSKTIGNHGPKWVNDVLQKDLNKDPELENARNFVKQLII